MSELENRISVCASTRLRRPESINSSTEPLQFSTPPSARRVGGEAAGGDVAELRRGHHLADRGVFVRREFVRREARARGSIVELAGQGGASPRTQAGGGEAYEPEDAAKTEDAAGAVDGS